MVKITLLLVVVASVLTGCIVVPERGYYQPRPHYYYAPVPYYGPAYIYRHGPY